MLVRLSVRTRRAGGRDPHVDGVLRGPEHLVEIIDMARARGSGPMSASPRRRVRASIGTAGEHEASSGRQYGRCWHAAPARRAARRRRTFRLVRARAAELRGWFDRNTGWRLHVDADVARLFKLASRRRRHPSGARPAIAGAVRPPPLRAALPGAGRPGARRRADHARPARRSRCWSPPADRSSPRRASPSPSTGARSAPTSWRSSGCCWTRARWRGWPATRTRTWSQAGDVLYDVERRVLAAC